MSSLPRTRSLRKPSTKPPSTDSTSRPTRSSSHIVSPSRLGLKPAAPRPLSFHGPSTTTTTTTTTPGTSDGTTGAARNPRPASMLIGRSASLSQKRNGALAAHDPVKRESRFPPLSSSSSARKPASSAASSAAKTRPTSAESGDVPAHPPPARGGPATHTRARSTVTSLSAATALQPLSREPNTSSKPGHTRSVSAGKAPSTPVGKQQRQPSTTAAAAKPRLRPVFSTLQQHYSPARTQAPKPLTSAILAPPSPSKLPVNVAASAETSRLQAELLQLHLLHRDARAVHAQWQASAEEKLGSRFRDLCQASVRVAEREASALEDENMLALRQWARGAASMEDKIQVLDDVVTNLWILSDPAGGRYARLIRRFERFLDRACEAEAARQDPGWEPGQADPARVLCADELDASWRDEVAALTRRLETWNTQFSSVADDAAGGGSASALGRMLVGVGGLLRGMLRELYAMGEMEALALAREEAWMERVNGGDEEGGVRGGAVWRVL
ncbi:hypothetical protein E4U53_003905 [Claviceps sorghi]|nr:hypothetical protein E4U53_003905 [Claviceps sorghi]